MNWLGIGLSGTNAGPLNAAGMGMASLPLLSPDAAWTGLAGSGFTLIPADPSRTTAKPACRLLVPPFQHFSDTLDVGVIAVANDGGTLVNALDRVRFHFEGRSVDVVEPRWHGFTDVNGQSRSYWGYWVRLKRPAQTSGTAQLYVEAIPADATMQKRVIGPYLFSPTSERYDGRLEVAASPAEVAGVRYKTLLAAISYAKGQNWQNPLITISEPGRYDGGDNGAVTAWDFTGYCNITASVPGVVIGRNALTGGSGTLAPNRTKWHLFGENITLDRRFISQFANGNSDARTHWLDGITITDAETGGRDALWDGGVRSPINMFGQSGAWFTECTITDVYGATINARLVRGCDSFKIGQDICSNALCVVSSRFDDHSNITWNTDIPAFTVQYSGAAAIATLARSGGTEGSGGGGVYTLTIGSSVATFDVGNAAFASSVIGIDVNGRKIDGWFFADVVAWLNTFPSITATLLIDPDRRANTGSKSGLRGQGFAASDIKAAPLTIQSHTDKHGDFYQAEVGSNENVVVAYNLVTNTEAQNIFLSPITSGATPKLNDMFFFGNVMNTDGSTASGAEPGFGVGASQIGRPDVAVSHLCIVQNSFADQQWLIRTDGQNATMSMDAYCLFKNNVAPAFEYLGGRLATQMKVENNRFYSGASQPPGGVDNIIGGTKTSLFANAPANDFAPSGALLDFGFAPMIPFDMNAAAFPASAAVGALASLSTLYVAPPTFVSSAITGTPLNGQVLTASPVVAGTQPIAVSYQWRKNGAIIAGQTGQTITLDRVTMGLSGGNRISCEITLTNTAGTASAEPFVFFDGGELPALLAFVAGKTNSGVWDMRQATDAGVWTASNLGGGLGSWTQATGGLKPGRSATDGAIFPGLIRATMPTGNSSYYLLLRKDPANDAQGHIIDGSTLYDPASGSTMAYGMAVNGGAVVTQRNALHAALDDGAWKILSRTGVAVANAGASQALGRGSTGSPDMDVRAVVVLNEAEFGGSLAAARSAAVAWLETLR